MNAARTPRAATEAAKMNAIYLDHSASSPMLPCVWEAMHSLCVHRPGNPASSHQFGRRARQALEDAREQIAALLGAHADEVLFTSGATEANNLAVFGLARPAPGTLVSSPIEHPCVLEPIRQLTKAGYALQSLPVAETGSVRLAGVTLPDDTRFACLMLANHETGALQPVAKLARLVGERAPVHCDAAAAAGKIKLSFHDLGVTSLTIGGHKFHGPPGIGALFVRRHAELRPLFFGGHQQHGKRPGTEAVALAVGMAAALRWSLDNLDAHRAHLSQLRQHFLERLRREGAPILVNGPVHEGLPGTLNIAFPGCPADALLMKLDLAGVACATGSACSSGSLLPSPVLAAMGKSGPALQSALRFSLSPLLTPEEIDIAATRIVDCIRRLRGIASQAQD